MCKLAVEYLRQGQTETALRKAKQALVKDPDNPQAHNLMALIYQRSGRDRLAEQHFRKAIGLGPGDPYILNAYTSFLCDRRKFAQARSQYIYKVLANPRYATPWIAMTNLGICARHGGDLLPPGAEYEPPLRLRHGRAGRSGLQPGPYPDSPQLRQL